MADGRFDVLLAGLGNIGFRHLQGLAAISGRIRLWGCDPDAAARAGAAAEWARIGGVAGGFVPELADAPAAIHACVLATPARNRLAQVIAIAPKVAGGAMLVEKVAFQSMPDLSAAAGLLAASRVAAFVNCPRRLWPLYREIRQRCAARPLAITVRGRNVGLASNAVHFIDLLQFLSGDDDVALAEWEGGIITPSKRPGYFEVRGRLRAVTRTGAAIDVSSTIDDPERTQVTVAVPAARLVIDEQGGEVGGDWQWEAGRAPYQSELTGNTVANLLDRRACGLASLATSTAAHAVVLEALGPCFAGAGFDLSGGVPIT